VPSQLYPWAVRRPQVQPRQQHQVHQALPGLQPQQDQQGHPQGPRQGHPAHRAQIKTMAIPLQYL
jgi:hypothetical protein